jgi:2-phospho-L-lactate guanylyltransferase
MRALIPFKVDSPKSRLSSVMSVEEREAFAKVMLYDLIDATMKSDVDVIDVAVTNMNFQLELPVNTIYAPYHLDEVVNEYFEKVSHHFPDEGVIVIMSDLPLLTEKNINEIVHSDADVVIAPGREGGTNILMTRKPDRFRVSYYEMSFLKHKRIAQELGLSLKVYDSFYASVDVDRVQDLVEVLIHSNGRAHNYLKSLGFELNVSKTETMIVRKR